MLPQGERTRRAVRWISDSLKESDMSKVKSLVHQAIFKFDLNPKESEDLIHFYERATENDIFPK